jgi:hypothetical protein
MKVSDNSIKIQDFRFGVWFFLTVLEFELRDYTFEPLHQPFFVMSFFFFK